MKAIAPFRILSKPTATLVEILETSENGLVFIFVSSITVVSFPLFVFMPSELKVASWVSS